MSERYIVIPNWNKHQHYKEQTRPPWIKLHTSLLHNPEWLSLTPGQRSALIGIWLVYASSRRRVIADSRSIHSQIGQRVTKRTLDALNHAGFIEFRSRDALDELYAREEVEREEKKKPLSKDPSGAQAETAERDIHKDKSSRGKGWIDNLGRYTGCRYVRGEFALTAKYDPLGMEPPPSDWPYERPSREEIAAALKEANA